jgi:hypothetical protein
MKILRFWKTLEYVSEFSLLEEEKTQTCHKLSASCILVELKLQFFTIQDGFFNEWSNVL